MTTYKLTAEDWKKIEEEFFNENKERLDKWVKKVEFETGMKMARKEWETILETAEEFLKEENE